MKHYFILTTQDALVLSQSNATTGNHQTLDYIPGSALLGALASVHYPTDAKLAWSLFHSGEVIFSNCYPLIEGKLGLPTPLSWHYKKGDDNSEFITSWVNQSSTNFIREENVQYEQLRGKYILPNGLRARPALAISTKTAIDRNQGTAKQGQLFNYQNIREQQNFIGCVECPNELDSEISQHLKGILRIGRSKGSEFGRVKISPISLPEDWLKTKPILTDNHLTLWCLSDIELIDEYGNPTLSPTPKDIHPLLEKATVLTAQTFIRYHSVNRFNGYRQCYDTESRLISKGSVITLELDNSTDKSLLACELSKGIGINRHLGYGQIFINPNWAQQALPKIPLFNAQTIEISTTKPSYIKATPLTLWVESRLSYSSTYQENHSKAISLVEKLLSGYISIRKFNNIPDAYQIGPSRSQWRRINDLLRSQDSSLWLSKTFEDERCIAKSHNDPQGWGAQWILDGRSITFANYCKKHMTACSETTLLKAIEILTKANPAEKTGIEKITLSIRNEKVITNQEQRHQEALS